MSASLGLVVQMLKGSYLITTTHGYVIANWKLKQSNGSLSSLASAVVSGNDEEGGVSIRIVRKRYV
jgi:hypothetical protein